MYLSLVSCIGLIVHRPRGRAGSGPTRVSVVRVDRAHPSFRHHPESASDLPTSMPTRSQVLFLFVFTLYVPTSTSLTRACPIPSPVDVVAPCFPTVSRELTPTVFPSLQHVPLPLRPLHYLPPPSHHRLLPIPRPSSFVNQQVRSVGR